MDADLRVGDGAGRHRAVTLLVIAAVLMFVYRFFYSGEVTFRQAFAIVTWIFFAVGWSRPR